VKKTFFTMLLQPTEPVIGAVSAIIDQESNSQKLFFADFVRKLIFGYVYQVSSLRNLALELKTNRVCWEVGLFFTPFSTLKDGFARFESRHFKQLFEAVLERTKLSQVPFLDEVGIFRVIDGSLFPTLRQMSWTSYRKRKNAFKLHLSFDLNRMIPVEFWIGKGNSSERSFMESVIESGITYIADRGYGSFALVDKVIRAKAFFVLRSRDNLLYRVVQQLGSAEKSVNCFNNVTDETVIFLNDERQNKVRLITFEVAGSYFRLIRNRFDLTTSEVIIIYAYRWQIELFFKFIKRTMNGIHLFNHSRNGTEIQFYVLLLVAVLMLKLKQECQKLEKEAEKPEVESKKARQIGKVRRNGSKILRKYSTNRGKYQRIGWLSSGIR
jgi:transposase